MSIERKVGSKSDILIFNLSEITGFSENQILELLDRNTVFTEVFREVLRKEHIDHDDVMELSDWLVISHMKLRLN